MSEIKLKLAPELEELIQAAAKSAGMNISDFILVAANEKAIKKLTDCTSDEELTHTDFRNALLENPQPGNYGIFYGRCT